MSNRRCQGRAGFHKGGTGHWESKDTSHVFPRMRCGAAFDLSIPGSLVVGSMSPGAFYSTMLFPLGFGCPFDLTEGSIDRNLSFPRTSIIEIDEPCFSLLRAVEWRLFIYTRERIKCTCESGVRFLFFFFIYLTFFTLSRKQN